MGWRLLLWWRRTLVIAGMAAWMTTTVRWVSIATSVIATTSGAMRMTSVVAMSTTATTVVSTSALHGRCASHHVLHEVRVGVHHAKQVVNLVLHGSLIDLLRSLVTHLFRLEVLHINNRSTREG